MPYQCTTLSPSELESILDAMSPTGDTKRSTKRLIEYLAVRPGSITVDVNRACSVGNISHYSTVYINPRIKHLGFQIACELPAFPPLNKFGEPTKQHLWSFYRWVDDAANDDPIEDAFREEVRGAAQ